MKKPYGKLFLVFAFLSGLMGTFQDNTPPHSLSSGTATFIVGLSTFLGIATIIFFVAWLVAFAKRRQTFRETKSTEQ
ncbi:MAG: hypothetical protein A3A80_02960 [Candidatus Terrybacteria bacterium RIFCSPLOWO2_01_FULL_44_24]|uniref:Uncharacterized protein n=1 Tax=Candidatus Terrybacteria bacterium RIFCSPHIGHO2_01_FULL_43_35 TaxID=1802361 RepID=A0A1G2PF40_9BACT|nr:MAG: hypothetical protein A2828_03145 [Candidatus Terrybacteria bacterium RIFCSPHIGHO2_01_FULL_43_35]OHA51024.1 MAG: hypothetical protein A3A80_02960 [Candidatus Terrybacteria bacterium RIFCSPLOWO2_01_FULL_44_24]